MKPQRPRMLRDVRQHIGRVEESYHRGPGCHVDRVYIVTEDERIEAHVVCHLRFVAAIYGFDFARGLLEIFDWRRT